MRVVVRECYDFLVDLCSDDRPLCSQSNHFLHIPGKFMWPPYTISNGESQTPFPPYTTGYRTARNVPEPGTQHHLLNSAYFSSSSLFSAFAFSYLRDASCLFRQQQSVSSFSVDFFASNACFLFLGSTSSAWNLFICPRLFLDAFFPPIWAHHRLERLVFVTTVRVLYGFKHNRWAERVTGFTASTAPLLLVPWN